MKIIIIIAAVILTLIFLFAFFTAGFTMTGRRQTLEEAFAWQTDHYDTSFYDALEKNSYTISGANGYTLHAELLKAPVPSDRYIILSHGYTDNRFGSLKYAGMYLDLGYNCIIYDLRGHGENEPTFTTYGILESQDLMELITDTRTRYPDLKSLGLHGESLGAATTLTALKYKPEIDFTVADCGFSDIENVLRGGFRSMHIPEFLFRLTDLGARLRYGYSLSKMRPIDSLNENTIPVLFIHGEDDSFILPRNSEAMYERTQGPKELFLMPGAGHAESVLTDPERYSQVVSDFLQTVR